MKTTIRNLYLILCTALPSLFGKGAGGEGKPSSQFNALTLTLSQRERGQLNALTLALSQRERGQSARVLLYLILCLLPFFALVGCGGGHDSKTTEEAKEAEELEVSNQHSEEMLLYAIDNLNRIEEFTSDDAFMELAQRFNPQNQPKPGAEHGVDPLLTAWPEPEMFRQIVDRLNQWVRTQQPPTDWKLDPMTATLPKPLLELPQVKNLAKMEFSQFDGFELLESAWLRDVGLWARGNVLDDLERARNLFDWTVRNIQLEADRPNRIPQLPWETLLFGRGTASERAWVFILLLRQLDIDAAILAIDEGKADGGEGRGERGEGKEDKAAKEKKSSVAQRPWCVGVLIEDSVYLFDPTLGLPIPGPNGVALDEAGQLSIRPATLAQVVADAKLMQRLDVDESHPYGVKASDLKRVTALLEASPTYLSRRTKLLESRLAGARKMVLTTSPTAQAKHWKAAHVADVGLWLQPFQTLAIRSHLDWRAMRMWLKDVLPLYITHEERQHIREKKSRDKLDLPEPEKQTGTRYVEHSASLYKGRVLYLRGKLVGDDGAIRSFQITTPSQKSTVNSTVDQLEQQIRLLAKQNANYWLGLIAYQRENYPSAIYYFLNRTIEAASNNDWVNGARYNLARTYEASGETQMAVLLYRGDAASPGYYGNLLRAKWLEEAGEKQKPKGD